MIYQGLGEKGKVLEAVGISILCPIFNVRRNTVHFEGIKEGTGEQAQVEKAMNKLRKLKETELFSPGKKEIERGYEPPDK